MESHPASDHNQVQKAFRLLLSIMDELREKCPWDQQQTMESLRHLTIEETFELSEAILEEDMEAVKKELGDLLLHIIFYAKIAAEQQAFTITNVIQSLCEKLVHRHPHIYGQETAEDAQAVKHTWEKQKLQEKGNSTVLGGVPKVLPSLIKAMRIQEKADNVGFRWPDHNTTQQKIRAQVQALTAPSSQESSTEILQKEFGALLFLLVNYARLIKINPEEALEKENKAFIKKFQHIAQQASKQGKPIAQLSATELMRYWEEAK